MNSGVTTDSPPTSLYIHLAQGSQAKLSATARENIRDARQRWWSAFDRCHLFTLRSLSFPARCSRYQACGPLELEPDATQSVMAILASGLPLPQSPSFMQEGFQQGRGRDPATQEREERGWWASKFQQTLREMQREQLPQIEVSATSLAPPRIARKIVYKPRSLKLGTSPDGVNTHRQARR